MLKKVFSSDRNVTVWGQCFSDQVRNPPVLTFHQNAQTQ
jgi:hypothetical protein